MKSKVAVLTEPRHFEVQERDITICPDEVLVKVTVCGLCTWELNHFKGMTGSCPMTLGHEWSGEVVETGKDVKNFKSGDKVSVIPDTLSGFAQYAAVKADHCFKIADDIDLRQTFLEPIKCIITVLCATAPEAGDYGIVLGCGPMGLWCIQALQNKLLSGLIAIDIDDNKLELASSYGADYVINSRDVNVQEAITQITSGHMADFVIEGTGIPKLLEEAACCLRTGRGRLILMSYHEHKAREMDFRVFSDKGIQMLNPHPQYSLDQLDDARRAAAMINKKTFVNKDFISHKFTLDEIQMAFETLENKPEGYIKGVVYPNDYF